MLWSKLFIPTLRENPAEAEVPSHQLLLRAGYIRQVAAGIYSYLFLAQRSLLRIQQIVRSEMDAIGAQEFLLPALNPAELWQESGRWDVMGDNMFRLKDRFGRDLCLGMTHEEIMTSIARGELRSYKQLPQIWYQIQTKFRDEPRPKSGLLRVRQFIMKDSYSFDLDSEGLDVSYKKHYEAYRRTFARCGLDVIPVEADSGAMGGSQSMEFMVASDAGEDLVVNCPSCHYAANLEKAISYAVPPNIDDPDTETAPDEFHTPGHKTIAEVADFTSLPETSQMKSLVMISDGKPVLALLRGDHQLSETKFSQAVGGALEVRPARPDEIKEWFGADPGSLGPIGITNMPVIADLALASRRNMITGANRNDYHLRNVTPGRDFKPEFADIRQVNGGDPCAACGAELKLHKAIEIGHIFKLGYKYSDTMGLRVLGSNGEEITPIMGSYGIGIERILSASIEQNHDDAGMFLPASIAPFTVIVTPVNNADAALREAARKVYNDCLVDGIDALYDDRDERPGVKFKDADLIGVPYRITIGKKLAQGLVELVVRKSRAARDVPVPDVVTELRRAIDEEFALQSGPANEPFGPANEMNWAAIRAEFPALRSWTWLNTATFGQIPTRTRTAVDAHFARREDTACGDFLQWFDDMDELRALIGQLIHCDAEDIAFAMNAASALSLFLAGMDWHTGDRIITLRDEFPNQYYFAASLAEQGVELIEMEPAGRDTIESLPERTRAVLMSTVNYTNGSRPDVARISRLAHEAGALLYLDGTQSVGALTLDIGSAKPDMLAVDGYKWLLCPNGATFFYVSPGLRPKLRPAVLGWRSDRGWRSVDQLHHGPPEMHEAAEKYEGGMLNFPSLYGMRESVRMVLEIGPDRIEQRVLELAGCAAEILRRSGATVVSENTNIIAAHWPDRDVSSLARALESERIIVAARHGNLRVSPHFYNNDEDLKKLEARL